MADRDSVATDWRSLGLLAPLLIYPSSNFPQLAQQLRRELRQYAPQVLAAIEGALEHFESLPSWQREELYTQAFDLNPVCTLEVGWHLYGEQYERGRFLVRARELLQSVGLEENGELPDFLPSLLMALPRCEAGIATDIGAYLVPALRTMCKAMASKEHVSEKEKEKLAPLQAYLPILEAVRDELEARVPAEAVAEAEARFRPQLEGGGKTRGMDPGPNGDFPLTEMNGISERPGPEAGELVKLGVSSKSPLASSNFPRGAVHGIPISEVPFFDKDGGS